MENKCCVLGKGWGIVIGAVVLGVSIILAVSNFKSYDRTVTVKGLCEMEVKADKVIYPLAFKVAGNNLESLYASVSEKNAVILDFLKSYGFTDEEITVSLPQVSDRDAEGYTQRSMRYIITSVITVYSTKVDKSLEMREDLAGLHKKGITLIADSWSYQPSYLFEGLNSIKPQMIEEATANAREAAQKFADDSGSRIGKIRTASQGQFSISDRDANTPYIKKVRVVTSVVYYLKG